MPLLDLDLEGPTKDVNRHVSLCLSN
jgi:hypothetical protein